jgi:hypothetical protein
MNRASIYALKVWQTAVFAAPLIIISFNLMNNTDFGEALLTLAFGIGIGMFFSIPSFILFAFACNVIVNMGFKAVYKKIVLSIIGIGLTMLAFVLFSNGRLLEYLNNYFMGIYALIIVAGVWFYKLEMSVNVAPQKTEMAV